MMSLFSGTVFAGNEKVKENNGKEHLVALGDSITFGHNLELHNQRPSKSAFPYLIGKETDLRVRNLGVSGMTSIQLLEAVKSNEKYRQAIKHADYITLNIGSNDLLQLLRDEDFQGSLQNALIAKEMGNAELLAELQSGVITPKVAVIVSNKIEIIKEIRSLTDAVIVMYNYYNPSRTTDAQFMVGQILLPGINQSLSTFVNYFSFDGIVYADAFSAFMMSEDPNGNLILNDIHPTKKGHEILAEIGLEALGINN
jgi:lysophospholipase L1-like esterase